MQTTMRQTHAWQLSGKCAATHTRCVHKLPAACCRSRNVGSSSHDRLFEQQHQQQQRRRRWQWRWRWQQQQQQYSQLQPTGQ